MPGRLSAEAGADFGDQFAHFSEQAGCFPLRAGEELRRGEVFGFRGFDSEQGIFEMAARLFQADEHMAGEEGVGWEWH